MLLYFKCFSLTFFLLLDSFRKGIPEDLYLASYVREALFVLFFGVVVFFMLFFYR